MQTVFVTGATGFVGRSLCLRLLASGYAVVALVRNQQKADLLAEQCSKHAHLHFCVGGELTPSTDWAALLGSAPEPIDVVIHLAARVHVMQDNAADPLQAYRQMNVDVTHALASAAQACGVKRFIFMSSIKVNGESTHPQQPFTELSKPEPVDPYGVSKLEAETAIKDICQQGDMSYVILRPPLIYGPGVGANFLKLIKIVATGVPLPFRSIKNKRSMIFIGNLVDIIIQVIGADRAQDQTFLVADGMPMSTWQLVCALAKAQNKSVRSITVPLAVFKLLLRAVGRQDMSVRLLGSLEVCNDHLCQQLGWQAPFSADEAISNTVNWYQNRDQH